MLDRADVRRQTHITVVLLLVTLKPWHDRGRRIYVAQVDLDAGGSLAIGKTGGGHWSMERPQPTSISASSMNAVLVLGQLARNCIESEWRARGPPIARLRIAGPCQPAT